MTIEEQSHQLFTSIIEHCRKGIPIQFEGQSFCVGTGPQLHTAPQESFFDLTGDCGLLGYGHPLLLKGHVQRALRSNTPVNYGSEKKEAEELLSELAGTNVYLRFPDQNAPLTHLGRNPIPEIKPLLNKCNTLTIIKTFSFPISISKEPGYYTGDCLEIRNILQFLKVGQFFGATGLIKNREEQLKQAFHDKKIVKKITGLVVDLNDKPKSDRLLIDKKLKSLLFPLSFNDNILELIKSELS